MSNVRVLLVGTASEREELRAQADDSGIVVSGEYETLREARASGLAADAILIAPPRPDLEEAIPVETLTARESEVLELLAEGLSNKAIAARLGISDQTVKFHVASIGGKLGAANRTEAVRLAVRRGLIAL
jgi:two-component system, NarL family, response regulator YdfI